MSCLTFLEYIYGVFGFEFKLELSTKPENALGDAKLWENAEKSLEEGLKRFGKPWKINPGDGAFYGPKIDIKVYDALKREHQLGTVQLDFNLPERFNLQYRASDEKEEEEKDGEGQPKEKKEKEEKKPKEKKEKGHKKHEEGQAHHEGGEKPEGEKKDTPAENKDSHAHKKDEKTEPSLKIEEGKTESSETVSVSTSQIDYQKIEGHLKTGFQRPVMIHRAILGSVERMFAILCEHTGGKWPFWLSPRQIKVVPISDKTLDYAELINNRLIIEGYSADIDRTNFTINKKVRNAQIAQFNYIAVVGEEERTAGIVDLRERDKDRIGKFTIQQLLKLFASLQPKSSDAYENVKAHSFFGPDEKPHQGDADLSKLNEDLQLKTFIDGDIAPGKADDEWFEKLKGANIDVKCYPNVLRWRNFVEKLKSTEKK